jgi:hypothetical protein
MKNKYLMREVDLRDYDTQLLILVRDEVTPSLVQVVSYYQDIYFLGGSIQFIKWYKTATKAVWIARRLEILKNIPWNKGKGRVSVITGEQFRIYWQNNLSGKDTIELKTRGSGIARFQRPSKKGSK